MAISIIGERRGGSGGIRLSGKNIEFVETRIYLIDGGDKNQTRIDILSTSGLPIVGTTVLSTGAICSSKQAERLEINPRYWEVTCEFATSVNDQSQSDPNNPNPDPTTWVPIYKISYENDQEPRIKWVDAAGKSHPLVNSASQAFSSPLMKLRKIGVFRFYQYESDSLSEQTIMDRAGKVNAGSFKGFPKWSLLLDVIDSERGYYNGYPARKVDYELRYKKGWAPSTWYKPSVAGRVTSFALSTDYSGWAEMVLDTGIVKIDTGKIVTAFDDNGNRMEVGLNGSGAAVPVTEYPAVLGFPPETINFNSFLRTA